MLKIEKETNKKQINSGNVNTENIHIAFNEMVKKLTNDIIVGILINIVIPIIYLLLSMFYGLNSELIVICFYLFGVYVYIPKYSFYYLIKRFIFARRVYYNIGILLNSENLKEVIESIKFLGNVSNYKIGNGYLPKDVFREDMFQIASCVGWEPTFIGEAHVFVNKTLNGLEDKLNKSKNNNLNINDYINNKFL